MLKLSGVIKWWDEACTGRNLTLGLVFPNGRKAFSIAKDRDQTHGLLHHVRLHHLRRQRHAFGARNRLDGSHCVRPLRGAIQSGDSSGPDGHAHGLSVSMSEHDLSELVESSDLHCAVRVFGLFQMLVVRNQGWVRESVKCIRAPFIPLLPLVTPHLAQSPRIDSTDPADPAVPAASVCASAHPCAAERRLTVTPHRAKKGLKRRIACLFDGGTIFRQHQK